MAALMRWKGPVVAIAGGEKYFGAVERQQATTDDGDATLLEFAVGDCVLLAGDAGEVVHVLAMWEAREGGTKRAEVRYFCNASATDRSLGRPTASMKANEVGMVPHTEASEASLPGCLCRPRTHVCSLLWVVVMAALYCTIVTALRVGPRRRSRHCDHVRASRACGRP